MNFDNISTDDVILITGANGGLGNALVVALKRKGFVNLLTPSRYELDLLNKIDVDIFFSKNKPTVVLHLASVVFGLLGNLENQMRSLTENTLINSNLFSAIDSHPVKYVFFAGTVAAYAYPYIKMPLSEADFFLGLPHSGEFGYAMSKRHAYAYLSVLQTTKKIRSTYGIFTNLYGENDRFNDTTGHVIPSLIMKAYHASKTCEVFNVWGDGLAERDFLHFDDAAAAIILCMLSKQTPSLVNISSGIAVSIKRLSNLIALEANVKQVEFLSDKPVGIKSRVVDNSVLKSLGFEQSISLEDGIKRLYAWYLKNNNEVRS
ncbi:NAD-dependent epimerase/dehydratase family protein [Aeromonas veronii]|uniref:NAD-dependent epimerase/dehydratase family protein n=1 Tax=Aeromonas veronii TaxID=654 RepID=UPI00354DA31B